MAFIGLGKIDVNLIPMLIGCIFCFLNRLLNQYDGALLFKNEIITNVYLSFGRMFALIPFIILIIRSKRVHNNEIQNRKKNNSIKYIYFDKKENITQGKWKFILFSAIIFFIESIFFVMTFKIKTNCWIWYIVIASLFYYLIFNKKLFKHHYLSAASIILLGLVIDLSKENLQNDVTNNLLLLLLRYLREILLSFHNVITKYIMEKKFCSSSEITFYNGLINVVLFVIFAILDYNYFGFDNYDEYFTNFNSTELLVALGEMTTQFGLFLTILITIRKNTPCHIFIIFVIGQFAYYIDNDISGISILVLICLIVIFFLALIFNEIIEINILGLSYNTKKNIQARSERESLEIMIITKDETMDDNLERDEVLIDLPNNEIIE